LFPVRQHIDELSGLDQMELVASLLFNRLRIVLERVDFLLQFLIVLRKRSNFLLEIRIFLLLLPERQVAVPAKDFSNDHDNAEQCQHEDGVAPERFVIPTEKIHNVTSESANLATVLRTAD